MRRIRPPWRPPVSSAAAATRSIPKPTIGFIRSARLITNPSLMRCGLAKAWAYGQAKSASPDSERDGRYRGPGRILAGPVAWLISPITFLISLFTSEVDIYEVQNNGTWYDFGFMLGVAMAFGGSAGGGSATAGRARRRSRGSG